MIFVERDDPRDAQATALLERSYALMVQMFGDATLAISVDDLTAPEVAFFTARRGTIKLGTAALVRHDGYGEVKSMFVEPASRRQGIASALLRGLEDEARELGLPKLMLETGVGLDAGQTMYERHGFAYRGPFAAYDDHPMCRFMEKDLCP